MAPRLKGPGDAVMTWITDNRGTRWVETTPRKRRKPPRAIRFANIQVGEQLMKVWKSKGWRGGKDNPSAPPVDLSQSTEYYIVTDLWFDPVAGQDDPLKGAMVGIARIQPNGSIAKRKEPHTKRGLASQQFHYADTDYIEFCARRKTAMKDGKVVGIGAGKSRTQRPVSWGAPPL